MSRAPRAAPDPLDADQRAAVRRAGATGLAFVGAGASLLWGLVVGALVLLILRAAVIDLFDDVEWGRGSVVRWIEELDPTPLAPLVLALVLLAVGAMAVGCWLSTRRMHRAGVPAAVAVTLRGAAIGTALQGVLSTLSSWLLGLLVLVTGVAGFWIVVAIHVVGSIIVSTLIGWLAGPRTWLAIARREAWRARAHTEAPPSAGDGGAGIALGR